MVPEVNNKDTPFSSPVKSRKEVSSQGDGSADSDFDPNEEYDGGKKLRKRSEKYTSKRAKDSSALMMPKDPTSPSKIKELHISSPTIP